MGGNVRTLRQPTQSPRNSAMRAARVWHRAAAQAAPVLHANRFVTRCSARAVTADALLAHSGRLHEPKIRVRFAGLLLLAATTARADVWYWFDANGATHYVDSDQAIYTWRDDQGKVHYSDKPDHEDAIRVQLLCI